jgi:predicted nucleic acid-binding protein
MKLYLDVSCLNRPFDDQSQSRIRLESEAVTILLDGIDAGRWEQVSSRMAEIEASAMTDEVRRRRVLKLLPVSRMELGPTVFERARRLVGFGLHAADAVHVGAAEALAADVLLTCDDRLLRRGRQIADELHVKIVNPVDWLKEQNDAKNPG